jgi:hypothetical protein
MGEVADASHDCLVFIQRQEVPRLIVGGLNVPIVPYNIRGLDCSVLHVNSTSKSLRFGQKPVVTRRIDQRLIEFRRGVLTWREQDVPSARLPRITS